MTARIQETLIAVTIASVDVHTNATISESPIETPLHTKGGPVLGSRLLPDIWTSPASPLVISEARRLTADPVAYAEARRFTAHPVAFSEVRRITVVAVASRRSRSPTQRRVASRRSPSPTKGRVASRRSPSPTKGRVASRRSPSPVQRRVASRRSPSPTQRLVASRRSPSPTQRRVASKGSPPPKRMGLASVAGPSSSRDPFIGIFVLQDAPPGTSSLHREVPLRPNEDAMRRERLSPLNSSTHLELRLKSPLKSSIEASIQDPLITIRVVIFASWRKNLLVQSLLLRANTLALVFMWIMAPISAILQGLDD